MADIDDELLALAGGDSEDEGSDDQSREISMSPPPTKKDTKKAPAKKAKRRPRQDDSDEEEGEASSAASSPNSLDSAPMDESDSDAENGGGAPPPGGENDEKYPVDGLYVSQAEKAEINAMRDLEREQILAERRDLVERQRQNRLLRQMVTNFENEERKQGKKKRSADTAELEDSPRKPSKRAGKSGETAMDSLRRARAEKQRRREDQEKRKDAFSPRRDFRDDEESDDDFGRPRSRTPVPETEREAPAAELRDYDRVRLGRNEFAQVCFTPGFEAAITGCYIRIALGPHPDTGVEQYRLALIKGFSTGRPYALNGPNGSFVTDQYVRAAHGKAVKEFPFIAASSGKVTENELNRYMVTCKNEGVTLPIKDFLSGKIDDINKLINHKWTSEDIKGRLNRKNELKKRFDPAERVRVAKLLEQARERADDQKIEELQEEFDKLGSQRLAFKTSLGMSNLTDSPKAATEQDRLAERNRENRRKNVEAVRKAQLKEKHKHREIEMAMKRGEQVADDPSRRLRTKAKFVHDINESADALTPTNGSETSTPLNGTPKTGAAGKLQALPHMIKLREEKHEKGLPTVHKPLMDDDVIGALDLDIDVEI